jgi:hypothetical protein
MQQRYVTFVHVIPTGDCMRWRPTGSIDPPHIRWTSERGAEETRPHGSVHVQRVATEQQQQPYHPTRPMQSVDMAGCD